jgi:hypothetical protein
MASLAEFQLARWFTAEFNERNPSVGERLTQGWCAANVDSMWRDAGQWEQ